jgi:AraC-like DNA-binding protein
MQNMTEPSYRLIAPPVNRSFTFKWEVFNLATPWHYHPEVELIYFIDGKTTGVIGDGFQHFEEGDLVLLGANFPHVLQENTEYTMNFPTMKPFGLIIQFTEDFLGKDFFMRPELTAIRRMLNRSRQAIHFLKPVVDKVKGELAAMKDMSETRKLFTLLNILSVLAETEEYKLLTGVDYGYDHTLDEERMRTINQYVYEHFSERITIRDVAAVANMTETSFCRYFKTRTLKNFTLFLNEVRISYACKLLCNSRFSVTEVCFQSGFNELSYFTRQFKRITRLSPLQYKNWKKSI